MTEEQLKERLGLFAVPVVAFAFIIGAFAAMATCYIAGATAFWVVKKWINFLFPGAMP